MESPLFTRSHITRTHTHTLAHTMWPCRWQCLLLAALLSRILCLPAALFLGAAVSACHRCAMWLVSTRAAAQTVRRSVRSRCPNLAPLRLILLLRILPSFLRLDCVRCACFSRSYRCCSARARVCASMPFSPSARKATLKLHCPTSFSYSRPQTLFSCSQPPPSKAARRQQRRQQR